MARNNNFLLGQGERLTHNVSVPSGGGDKNPPYDFARAKERVQQRLERVTNEFAALPLDASPGGEVVAVVTMHPRYVSKSDFPEQLFAAVEVRAIGSRSTQIKPESWGIKEHPEKAITEQIFVAGTRDAFASWKDSVGRWERDRSGASDLAHIEEMTSFATDEKLKTIPDVTDEVMLELVLHNDRRGEILKAFGVFAENHHAHPLLDRARSVQGLSFVPVRATPAVARELAQFSFVRVVRGMPTLRPLPPSLVRAATGGDVDLPDADAAGSARAVVFDGGLPDNHGLDRWVTLIEPPGIGPAVAFYQDHGLWVTSALLFGHLGHRDAPQPFCQVDHVRVLDVQSGDGGADLQIVDALDRIVRILQEKPGKYRLVNLSIGPSLPISDDEVTAWTATLDDLLASLDLAATVAVGNEGERDAASGLNRLQPPSDGVNVLAVGAADSLGSTWGRASYSCVGPGRSPGLIKPDGVAFGGSASSPFMVIGRGSTSRTTGVQGTSFAAPLVLRTISGVHAMMGANVSPLALRALMIHRAESAEYPLAEVGWGRFLIDPNDLVTCEDDEAIVVFQGQLPVGEHLRAPLPMPLGSVKGMVTISATLLIAPDVDPEHPGAYTRSGLEIAFRPNSQKYRDNKDGTQSAHPTTRPFFTPKNMYGAAEFDAREDGHKWEPCRKNSQAFRPSSLDKPCFDIYYHHRASATRATDPKPITYALIVGIRAPKTADFYARLVRTYANILVPLRPRLRIQVRTDS